MENKDLDISFFKTKSKRNMLIKLSLILLAILFILAVTLYNERKTTNSTKLRILRCNHMYP